MNEQTPGTTPYRALAPREMKLSPRGASSEPVSRRFPQIRGGQCERCGTVDKNYPGDLQYKLCEHYRGMDAKCIYCPLNKDQDEVVRNSTLNVAEDPYNPGSLMMWCGSYECSRKHLERFRGQQ